MLAIFQIFIHEKVLSLLTTFIAVVVDINEAVFTTCRTCAIVGGYSDGNTIWKHSMGLHDDPSQEVKSSTEGKDLFLLLFKVETHMTIYLLLQFHV